MTPRMFAAIFAGVLSAGAMLLPVETAARPGGGGMAPGPVVAPPPPPPPAFRGPMMRAPQIVRPPVARPPIAAQPALQGRIAPIAQTEHRPYAGRFLRDHHRRFPGAAWPLAAWWPSVPYGDSYGVGAYPAGPDGTPAPLSATVPAPIPPAPTPVVQQVTRIIVYRGGCESNAETTTWRDGSPRTITMVRC